MSLRKSAPWRLFLQSLPAWLVSVIVHGVGLLGLFLAVDPIGPQAKIAETHAILLEGRFGVAAELVSVAEPTLVVVDPPIQPVSEESASSAQATEAPPEVVAEVPSDAEVVESTEVPAQSVAMAETVVEQPSEVTEPDFPQDEGPAVHLQLPDGPITRKPTQPWRSQLAALTTGSPEINDRPTRQTQTDPQPVGGVGDPGGTSFFQISSSGNVFCYVVDCSSSMDEHGAISLARQELLASLSRLAPPKRFQILFYDSELHPLGQGTQKASLKTYLATDANRKLARQFVLSQQPDGGTQHLPALIAALKSEADVIYFLSDGATPELSPRDLQSLRRLNRQSKQIHVIEFGRGVKLGTSWLDTLADDHQGIYHYRDLLMWPGYRSGMTRRKS